jgi:hypothetical protein
MNDLSNIKNFGPYMVKIMNEIGIFSREDLLNSDYLKIKNDLISKGIKPHINIFYSIEMGLQEREWFSITPSERREILCLFERE